MRAAVEDHQRALASARTRPGAPKLERELPARRLRQLRRHVDRERAALQPVAPVGPQAVGHPVADHTIAGAVARANGRASAIDAEDVVPGTADEEVVAEAAAKVIVASAAEEDVCSLVADQVVGTAPAVEDVRPAAALVKPPRGEVKARSSPAPP
jgi:hypothetical protein